MNRYGVILVLTTLGFLPMSQAFAWSCSQRCPSSIFSGKLECEAYKRACPIVGGVTNAIAEATSNSFSVENSCNDVILVTVEYFPIGSNGSVESSFTFSPNEKARLITTKNRYVYVSAKSAPSYSNKGNAWERKEVDMGAKYVDYTYTLSCN